MVRSANAWIVEKI